MFFVIYKYYYLGLFFISALAENEKFENDNIIIIQKFL